MAKTSAAGTAILACGLPLALAPDVGLHYYRTDVPQYRTAMREGIIPNEGGAPLEHEAGHAGDHGHSGDMAPGEGGDEGSDQE